MNVREIMSHVVREVAPGESLQQVARLMRDYDIGCVPVCERGHLVGILTDRDLVTRALAQTSRTMELTAGEVMTARPICCRIDDTIKQAAAIMEQHRVRRLPVLDFEGRLAGIVTVGDISTQTGADISAELIGEVSRREHSFLAKTG